MDQKWILNIERKTILIADHNLYWMLYDKIYKRYTVVMIYSEYIQIFTNSSNLLHNVLLWMKQLMANFFVQPFTTFWTH